MKKLFLNGLRDGIPIALGYLSVGFGFGIFAVSSGLTVLQAVGISASNLTSAGQVAGVEIIAAAGTLFEIILTLFVINIRYSLMGISLSQKLDSSFGTVHRLIASFGITDEIFAVSYAQKGKLKPIYMYGLILIAFIGWSGGTLLGAASGEILPQSVMNAMGVLLYAMFTAVIIPASRESRGTLFAVVAAACLSCLFKFAVPALSSGFSVIISGIVAAALAALLFPVKEEN